MLVRVFVCMSIYLYACSFDWLFTCVSMFMHVFVCVLARLVRALVGVPVCDAACLFIYIYIYMCVFSDCVVVRVVVSACLCAR